MNTKAPKTEGIQDFRQGPGSFLQNGKLAGCGLSNVQKTSRSVKSTDHGQNVEIYSGVSKVADMKNEHKSPKN